MMKKKKGKEKDGRRLQAFYSRWKVSGASLSLEWLEKARAAHLTSSLSAHFV
jgi:hypothetical protein